MINLGLVLIIIAWVYQLLSKEDGIQQLFVLLHALGVTLIGISLFKMAGDLNSSVTLALTLAVINCLVYLKLRKYF